MRGKMETIRLVCKHLQAWINYTDTDIHLYFWRTRSGAEVDFIIYRGDEKLMKGHVLCMPCKDFLLELRPGQWV